MPRYHAGGLSIIVIFAAPLRGWVSLPRASGAPGRVESKILSGH
jgi:hypothetical protein